MTTSLARQIRSVVEGAVRDAFNCHPEYLTKAGKTRAHDSIVKRVAGTVTSYVEQSTWGRSGLGPAAHRENGAVNAIGHSGKPVQLPAAPIAGGCREISVSCVSPLHCSFCGKPQHEVGRIVTIANALICQGCETSSERLLEAIRYVEALPFETMPHVGQPALQGSGA